MKKLKVGIVGASGYSGEELCTILARHPFVEISCVTSRQHAGKRLVDVLPRLAGRKDLASLTFINPDPEALKSEEAGIFFLALPHGQSAIYAKALLSAGKRVLDLSADFRLRDLARYKEFYQIDHPAPELLTEAVYGLPEIVREQIREARLVACPGCYPTSILLPLIPLLRQKKISPERIIASCLSGVSGAGRKTDVSLLYAECNESARAYGVPKHRHLSEIEQELEILTGAFYPLTFVPHLIPLTRGMIATLYVEPTGDFDADDALHIWSETFADEPFVRVSKNLPDAKHVTGTNYCDLSARFDDRTGRLLLFSALDNLTKGAAGQGVQNLNIIAGCDEEAGLLV